MRHAGPLNSEPTNPDEDDLVALADAVREGSSGGGAVPFVGATGAPLNGFADSQLHHATAQATAPSSSVFAPPDKRSGRRRGHLRVLPDPSD